jgi:hypothetical protein
VEKATTILARLRGALGLDRITKEGRQAARAERSGLSRTLFYAKPAIILVVLVYNALLVWRYAWIRGDELQYPQRVLAEAPHNVPPGAPMNDGSGKCARSDIVATTAYILEVLVNQNAWVPGDPLYKIGWFGVVDFDSGPFLDNKASFQRGALRAVRRVSIELVDLLGRVRGTSAADPDLTDARGALQWPERAWWINSPFDPRLPIFSESASSAFDRAINLFQNFNAKLESCNGVFDSRSDNLYQLLDRISNEIGGMTDELSTRAKAYRWDPRTKQFVDAPGNNLGVFDFRADNLFYEAHGLMWAYHGIMQAVRVDFQQVVTQSNLDQVWDRMETHIAETAALSPAVVSNGAEDSLFFPAHLSAMAVNMLRARANMTELREVLTR